MTRLKIGVVCVAATVLLIFSAFTAVAAPANAANDSQQTGLVNVSLGDLDVLNNVNLAVAANIAATVCDIAVPVSVLATQLVGDGGMTVCTTSAGPLTIDQALNGPHDGRPNAGGNNSRQAGLVNISLGDVAILNNVNLAVAANVAATVCDVTVPVAVLALQVIDEGGETVCTTAAGPLTVDQAQ
jgi:hypothetical protein